MLAIHIVRFISSFSMRTTDFNFKLFAKWKKNVLLICKWLFNLKLDIYSFAWNDFKLSLIHPYSRIHM